MDPGVFPLDNIVNFFKLNYYDSTVKILVKHRSLISIT